MYGNKYGAGGRSSNSGLTVTVFGSTGFLGRYLLTELGACGTRVFAPFRGDEMEVRHLKPMFDLGQLALMPFDVRNQQSVVSAIKHSDVVINLIGKNYETKYPLPVRKVDGKLSRVNYSFEEVHIDVPVTLAKLCKEVGVKRFIHVSSLSAHSKSNSLWSKSKAVGEERLISEFPDAIIVKLATVFGAEDRFLNIIAEATKRLPFFPLLNGGANLIQPVHVSDVAKGLHEIVKHYDSLKGTSFQFTGPAEYSYKEIAEFVQDVTLLKNPLVDCPLPLARFMGRISENFITPVWTEDMVNQITENVTEKNDMPGLSMLLDQELGSMDRLAFDYLHRFRKGGHFTLVKGYH